MKSLPALLIFIKNPELGTAKTRLAKTVGDERALRIYRELLRHTREVATEVNAERYLYYSKFVDTTDDWLAANFNKALQPEGNLGTRMQTAFAAVLAQHDRAVIVGSDCATLTPEIVEQAFTALNTHDAVLGPAADGGYYLLGLKDLSVDVFSDMVWSVDTVAEVTRQRLADAGKTVAELVELSDIDTEADWVRYGWEVE